ncbi:MAG: AAC(3) family N-acetyltransferase [Butyrivibrio sp.]|nr:AAC(3) family N-acetyltransferase [Butyrivibrio sp.]
MSSISMIKASVFQMLPKTIQDSIHAHIENKKIAYWQECFKTKIAREEVDEIFSQMVLDADVMIHSSLPDIGDIKLKHIVDNLQKHVLNAGHTVLCPALPVKGSTFDYLKSIREFDVRTAPNAMGTISRYYGRQSGARRSLSPTHSVIAFGDQAMFYTKDHHESETPFSESSPYFKLILKGGKILMFGAALKHLTFSHVPEDLIGERDFPVQVYDSHRFDIDVINEDGVRMKRTFRAHSYSSGRKRDSSEIMGIIRNLASTQVFQLGCGEVILLDSRDVILCLLTQLKSGVTTMGHRKVSEACKLLADKWIKRIEEL